MKFKYLLCAILFSLILFSINNNGFWHDEMFTYALIQGHSIYPFPGSIWDNLPRPTSSFQLLQHLNEDQFFNNLQTTIIHEGHPPLYYFVLKIWTTIFGNTLFTLRLLSALCITIAILIIHSTRTQHSTITSNYLLLLVVLTNPFLFYFGTEARMYSLGTLLAAISFKYSLRINKRWCTPQALIYTISSASLVYTHYFGVFTLSTLALYSYTTTRNLKLTLFHLVPILFMLPWVPVVLQQLSLHQIHWTDGALSLTESIQAVAQTILTILSTQPYDRSNIETICLIIAVIILAVNRRNSNKLIQASKIIAFYFLQIAIFDLLFDKHTISIPRYHIFLAPIVYHFLYAQYALIPSRIGNTALTIVILVNSYSITQTLLGKRSIKQMNREAAAFIMANYSPFEYIIVVEPKGPIACNLAAHLNADYTIAIDSARNSNLIPLYLDENLGLLFRENQYNHQEKAESNVIYFNGLNLYTPRQQ